MFVVTTSVVTALLGVSQGTHPCQDPPVSLQALKPILVSVTGSGMKRLKSLLRTPEGTTEVVTTNTGGND